MRARDNPFSTDRVLQVRYRPQGVTWDALMARLEAFGWRAAIVGPEGSGKTTLLEDLAPRLKARGFETRWIGVEPVERRGRRISLWEGPSGPDQASADKSGPDQSKATEVAGGSPLPHRGRSSVGPRDVFLVDGADALSWLDWLRFKRFARRAGGLVVTTHAPGRLPTLVECATSPGLLREIVEALLGPAEAASWRDRAEEIYARHRGNLREALRELYDLHAGRAM
jgi:hypothetical protein